MNLSIFKNLYKFSSGFTLLEMLIVTAIFSVVVLSMFSLFGSGLKTVKRSEAALQEFREFELFEYRFRKEIKRCQDVLYYDGRGLTLWREDSNHDNVAGNDELTAYYWNGSEAGDLNQIELGTEKVLLKNVTAFDLWVDKSEDHTLVEILMKMHTKNYWIVVKKE